MKMIAIFALLIVAGTAGAEWVWPIPIPNTHNGCNESSLDRALYFSNDSASGGEKLCVDFSRFDVGSIASDAHEDAQKLARAIAEIAGSPVNNEDLEGAKGGASGFNSSVPTSMVVSAITLWDEVKPKRSTMQNQFESHVKTNHTIRR